jgi:hypothetical protein
MYQLLKDNISAYIKLDFKNVNFSRPPLGMWIWKSQGPAILTKTRKKEERGAERK